MCCQWESAMANFTMWTFNDCRTTIHNHFFFVRKGDGAGPFIRVYSSIDQGDVNSLHKHNSFSHPWTSLPMGIFICRLYNVQLTQIYVGKFYNVQPTGIIFCKLSNVQQTEIFFLVNLTMLNINLFTMCTCKNCGVQLLTINPFLGRVGVPLPVAFLAS